jgi:flagellin-like hook-associated protein FlgL
MSITINSNLASTNASLNLKRASSRLSKSIQRLSSGNRIISASDDAGGLAVAMKLQSSLKRATAAMTNTQNGTSFLQMQDSVLKIAGEIIDRMSELKSFWNDISKSDSDRATYNHEFRELQKELISLKGQKFNGVSVFASVSPDEKNLKIITSDDGTGEAIQINRLGLFENLKSKYGADGVLNSGSHGEYRQLIGEFTGDAGILDANPGYTSRPYAKGEVVFKRGTSDADSGYFMALNDVITGAPVEDTQSPNSNWIRIADKTGAGFSEAYPDAPFYDHTNLKFTSSGDAVAYLEGDVLKVQAHWNDPNSFVYIKAQTDVPRNITLDSILDNGIGEGQYFEYVGSDSAGDVSRPATSYIMPNSLHESPDDFNEIFTSGKVSLMGKIIVNNTANGFTPSYVQVGDASSPSIYHPSQNWEIKEWNNGVFKYGDIVIDKAAAMTGTSDSYIVSISKNVKGLYLGGAYEAGDIVQANGNWYKATTAIAAEVNPVTDTTGGWSLIADPLSDPDFAGNPALTTANHADLSNDKYWARTHFGALVGKTIDVDYTRGDNIYYEGKHYVYTSLMDSSDQLYTAGTGQDGITNFEQLLSQGAVTELKLYVDTVGGGGSPNIAKGVYYKPNEDLEFIDRLPNTGFVRTNSIERTTDPRLGADGIFNSNDDIIYAGLNPGNDGIYGTMDDYYTTTAFSEVAKTGGHIDSDADNNKDLLDTSNGLEDFSVADFVDYIQTIANLRAVNGGTMSRLDYASRMLEENQVNLEAARARIMDADMAKEAARMAQQNVLMQAGAAMVSQANQMNSIVLQLLQ